MTNTPYLSDNHPRLLTVAVTSRALFDLEEGNALFEREGLEAYAQYQRQREDDRGSVQGDLMMVWKCRELRGRSGRQKPLRVERSVQRSRWSARCSPAASDRGRLSRTRGPCRGGRHGSRR